MDLIERYLQSVRTFLPKAQVEDIIRELRANLEAQIEDREGQLGRSLTPAEIEDLLRKHGNPLVVASRYRPHRHLVGPVVFPYFWIAVKIGMAVALLVTVIGSLVSFGSADPVVVLTERIMTFPFRFLQVALPIFAVLTIAAAVFELFQEKSKWWEKWDPKSLPTGDSIKKAAEDLSEQWKTSSPKWHWRAWTSVFGQGFFILWWALLIDHPFFVFGPACSFLALGPGWQTFHTPVLHLAFIGLLFQLIPVFRPRLLVLHAIADIANAVIGVFIVKAIFGSGDIVSLLDAAKANPDLVNGVALTNRIVSVCQVAMSVFMTFTVVLKVFKWLKRLSYFGAAGADSGCMK